jgi:hypothetical protein
MGGYEDWLKQEAMRTRKAAKSSGAKQAIPSGLKPNKPTPALTLNPAGADRATHMSTRPIPELTAAPTLLENLGMAMPDRPSQTAPIQGTAPVSHIPVGNAALPVQTPFSPAVFDPAYTASAVEGIPGVAELSTPTTREGGGRFFTDKTGMIMNPQAIKGYEEEQRAGKQFVKVGQDDQIISNFLSKYGIQQPVAMPQSPAPATTAPAATPSMEDRGPGSSIRQIGGGSDYRPTTPFGLGIQQLGLGRKAADARIKNRNAAIRTKEANKLALDTKRLGLEEMKAKASSALNLATAKTQGKIADATLSKKEKADMDMLKAREKNAAKATEALTTLETNWTGSPADIRAKDSLLMLIESLRTGKPIKKKTEGSDAIDTWVPFGDREAVAPTYGL